MSTVFISQKGRKQKQRWTCHSQLFTLHHLDDSRQKVNSNVFQPRTKSEVNVFFSGAKSLDAVVQPEVKRPHRRNFLGELAYAHSEKFGEAFQLALRDLDKPTPDEKVSLIIILFFQVLCLKSFSTIMNSRKASDANK